MSTTISLVYGNYSFPLKYNSGNDFTFKLLDGGSASSRLSVDRYTPDSGNEIITRLKAGENIFTFDLWLGDIGGDADNVIRDIADLFRWIGGEDQNAARYWVHGDVNRVVLEIQKDGASSKTVWPVVYGDIADKGQFLQWYAENGQIDRIPLELHLSPMGEAEHTVTLENYVKNPLFEIESSTGGLAANWTITAGTPTATLDTAVQFLGIQSQKLVFSAGSEQFSCDTMTISDGGGYIIAHVSSGADVRFRLRQTSGSPANIGDDPLLGVNDGNSVSDMSWLGEDGKRWYRVPLGGATGGSITARLQIMSTGVATVYLAVAYLQSGVTSPPATGFIGYRTIANRGDVSATNPQNQNLFDIGLIRGDARPTLDIQIVPTATSSATPAMAIAMMSNGVYNVQDYPYWYDSSDFGTQGSGFATIVDAARPDGEYEQYTGVSSTSNYFELTISGESTKKFVVLPRRIFALVRSSTTNTKFYAQAGIVGDSLPIGGKRQITTASTWELVDLGTINKQVLEVPTGSYPGLTLEIYMEGAAGGGDTADLGAIVVFPNVADFIIAAPDGTINTFNGISVLGGVQHVSRAGGEDNFVGQLWGCRSGSVLNRYVFAHWDASTKEHTIDKVYNVSALVTARTQYMMGVV